MGISFRRGVSAAVLAILAVSASVVTLHLAAQAASPIPIPYTDAEALFAALRPDLLPAALRRLDPGGRRQRWSGWVASRDAEIRARILAGNEDSVVNLLLYGTGFTPQPRFRYTEIPAVLTDSRSAARLRRRIEDLAAAVRPAGTTGRLAFARGVMASAGVDVDGPPPRVHAYLTEMTTRAVAERRRHDEADAAARRLEDPNAAQILRGTLYADRGLATDTTLFSSHALEETLRVLHAQALPGGAIRRVAVVGPGLDFVDKQEGYDFYPVQTIQPFAVIDSLVRVGMADEATLLLSALDLNPAVIAHVQTAREHAAAGRPYRLWLPREESEQWTPALAGFWERLGTTIGTATPVPAGVSAPPGVRVHVVDVRPSVVRRITAHDLNIVVSRLDLRDAERFDLIVTTNTLVYYDVFEPGLALANIAAMLRPGGIFLTNNLILPNDSMELVGHTDVPYTASGDGDRIVWYRRR